MTALTVDARTVRLPLLHLGRLRAAVVVHVAGPRPERDRRASLTAEDALRRLDATRTEALRVRPPF